MDRSEAAMSSRCASIGSVDAVVYSVDFWGEAVGEGATEAHYCTVGAIGKRNTADAPFIIANEYICGRIALMLPLPVPPGAIMRTDDGGIAYLALRFGQKDEKSPPVIWDDLFADEEKIAAGVAAFDCWIANTDRHAKNIAYVRDTMPVVAFDHSHALLGPNEGPARLHDPAKDFGASELAQKVKTDNYLDEWASRIGGISSAAIEDVCKAASDQDALSEDQAQAVASFLTARQGRIMDLLKSSITQIQWGLS